MPTDKAANNVVVVQGMYNINIVKQELSSAKTYGHNLLEERHVINSHRCHMAAKFTVLVEEDHDTLQTLD